MAGDLNQVTLIGRLTRDPELRQTGNAASLCRFSIASNYIYVQNGERREEVSFFNCTAWGRRAETIQQYCHKGKQVAISGRLRQNTWQDNEGKKNSMVEVVVEQLQFLGAMQNAPMQESAFQPPMAHQETPAPSNGQEKQVVSAQPPHHAAEMEDDDIPF